MSFVVGTAVPLSCSCRECAHPRTKTRRPDSCLDDQILKSPPLVPAYTHVLDNRLLAILFYFELNVTCFASPLLECRSFQSRLFALLFEEVTELDFHICQ